MASVAGAGVLLGVASIYTCRNAWTSTLRCCFVVGHAKPVERAARRTSGRVDCRLTNT
jgi:hypothetical protein